MKLDWKIMLMKKRNITGLCVGLCVCALPLAGRAQANHVNIMPFGDSVTAFGSSPESSYRYWLWKDLTDTGFNNFDFIGSNGGVGDGAPANSWPDENYEGGGNDWTSASALADANNAGGQNPDIVLLDFGSNDYLQNWETADLSPTRTNLDQTIEAIRASDSNPVIILIAKPTRWVTTDRGARRFMSRLNSTVSKVVRDEKRAGANIMAVNLFGGFNPRTDTKDGTHPNVRGEQKIAARYFQVLRRLLKRM